MAEALESSTVFVDVASEAMYPIAPEVVEEPKAEPDMSEIGPLLVEKNATNTARLRCPDCKRYTATTEEKMLRHIRKTHRGENPFQCYMCDYSTYNKVLFEEHVRIHQGIKPYKCSYCPYRSVSKKNTKKHELVHRPDNPRKCDQCGFIARHEKGLKHHLRIHGDNEDLECSLCKQSFSDVAGFNSHRKSKKRCPECKSMFCKSIIAKHRQEAHGVVGEKKTSKKSLTKKNLFTCAICQWEGNTKPRILLHLIHHPDQEEEMSSKSSKKTTNPNPRIRPLEPIITRTKSAQQRRQLRNKTDKKTEKPKLTKPEIKSPKSIKPVIRSKEALLKEPVKSSVEVIEQVEYYPNRLKRKLCTKKIMLKPKHNFKVVAATNKRKLATPKRGLKSPTSKQGSPRNLLSPKRSKQACNSPELTMQDMVRLVEETRSLSDEDFMEILTCPSPVWWEDPPDGGYDEDSICTRSPERLPEKSTQETKKRKITKTKPFNKTNNNCINIEQKPEQITIKPIKKDERFVQKKLKLENILGNIKNKTIKPISKVKNSLNENRNRKVSDSEGDISDLSFNEEEILKNLENIDIPIEPKIPVNIKKEIDVKDIKNEITDAYDTTSKNEKVVSENLSNVDIKSEIKEEFHCQVVHKNDDLTKLSKCDDNFNVKSVNIDNQSTKISNVDTSGCRLSSNKDSKVIKDPSCSKNLEIIKNHEQNNLDADNSNKDNSNENFSNKKSTDLSEYITVYKIIPDKSKSEITPEKEPKPTSSSRKTKMDSIKGKLNNFFKHCKNNKRVRKSQSPVPAIPLTDVKQEIIDNESSDSKIDLGENSRLKGCDSVVKTENEMKKNGELEKAPNLHCHSCDFLADTKEIYSQHVSSCKDVARLSWKHNYVLNQT